MKTFLFVIVYFVIISTINSQACDINALYDVSFGSKYPNNVVNKAILQQYTYVYSEGVGDYFETLYPEV